jgi:hypothetical protein
MGEIEHRPQERGGYELTTEQALPGGTGPGILHLKNPRPFFYFPGARKGAK